MGKAVKAVAAVAVGVAVGFATSNPWAGFAAGAAMYASSSLTPEANIGASTQTELKQVIRSSKEPAHFQFGRGAVGGLLAWAQEEAGDETKREWLHMVYVLSEGEIDSVDELYLNQEPAADAGDRVRWKLYRPRTTAPDFLLDNSPDWRDNQIGRGISFARVSLRYDRDYFASGIPTPLFVLRGNREIYDPRTDTTGYSENWALVILWYLRTRLGVPDDEIIWEMFISAANVSDETVTTPDGGTEPRYTIGGGFKADTRRDRVLADMEAAGGGQVVRIGGRFGLMAGAYYGPYELTIDEDMVIGAVNGQTEVAQADAVNTMTGKFIDPDQRWTETDYPAVSVADWVEADGGPIEDSLDLQYVFSPYQAQRLANIALRKKRAGGSLSLTLNFRGYACRPGRVVRVYLPSINIDGEFRIIDWDFHGDSGCKVTLSSEDPEIYDDAVGEPYDPLGFISLPTGGIAAPSGLTYTLETVGETVQGRLDWSAVSGAQSYSVVLRRDGQAVQAIEVPPSATTCTIGGLPAGQYVAEVRTRGSFGQSGAATVTFSVNAPPMPDSVVVQVTNTEVTLIPQLAWNGTPVSFRFYYSPTLLDINAVRGSAQVLSTGASLVHTGRSFGTIYYYWVESVNAYGHSDLYALTAQTTDDIDELFSRVDDELRRPGGLVDQLENGINDNAEQLNAARQAFDDRVDDANARIDEADSRADELSARADEALTNAQAAIDNATAALDQGALNGQDIESVRSNLDAAQSTIDALRLDVSAIQTDGATIDYVERITQQLEQMSALRYTALRAISSGNAATIDVVQNVMATDKAAMTQQIEQQSSRIDNAEGRITRVDTTYADQYGALSSRIGELSAKIDAAPTFGSGFEPGADLDQWNVPSSNMLAAQTTDVYAGIQSALVTSSRTAPSSTQVPNAQIPSGATAAFAGYEVVVRIAAKKPASGASSEFAVRYTGGSQNSGWQRFTPTDTWALYEFRYDVAEGARSNDRIAVWADTSGAGGGVLIDAVSVRRADAAITEITALIEREQQVRASEDEANARDTRTLKSSFEGAQSRNEQRFDTLTRDGDALATRAENLESTVGDHASQIQTLEHTSAGRDNAETIRYLAQSAKTALAATSIEVVDIQRINDREALAQRIVTVNAELAGNIAGLRDQYTALSNAQTAIAERVETTESQIGENAANITETRTTIAEADQFQAIARLAQSAKAALAAATLDVEQIVRASDDEALAQITTKLRADLESASSSIDQRLTALVNGQQSLAQTVTDIQTDYGDAISTIRSDMRSLSDGQQAFAETIDRLDTEFGNRASSIESTVSSLSDDQQSIAQRQERFETTVDDQFASVESNISAVYGPDGAVAQSIQIVEVNGKKAMTGMMVDGELSQIVLVADQIGFYNPVSGELINAGVIENGRAIFNRALIKSLKSDNIDVDNLTAAVVKSSKLEVDWGKIKNIIIDGKADIKIASIGTAEIEGQAITLPSSTYAAGEISVSGSDWQDIAALTVESTGSPTQVSSSFGYYGSGGREDSNILRYRILRNSQVVREGRFGQVSYLSTINFWFTIYCNGVASPLALDNPPAGNNTYKIQVKRDRDRGGLEIYDRYLGTLEVKR